MTYTILRFPDTHVLSRTVIMTVRKTFKKLDEEFDSTIYQLSNTSFDCVPHLFCPCDNACNAARMSVGSKPLHFPTNS